MLIRSLHLTDLEAKKPTVKKLILAECLLTVSHCMRGMCRATRVVGEGGSMAEFPSHPASSLYQLVLGSFILFHDLYLEACF